MNIRTLALALAIMPAIASAQDNNSEKNTISNKNTYDTTFVFNKQKYEISQTGERTNVKVYKANGSELEKTLETQYLDGQQVEQVYITSPFIPRRTYKRKSQEYSHYPGLFFGLNILSGSAFGASSAGIYTIHVTASQWNGVSMDSRSNIHSTALGL